MTVSVGVGVADQSVNTFLNSSLQTGITVMIAFDLHHAKQIPRVDCSDQKKIQLTVDGNGNALAQDIAVAALERRDLAQLVELAVVIAHAFRGLGVDDVELEVVGLGDGEQGGRAWVALLSLLHQH